MGGKRADSGRIEETGEQGLNRTNPKQFEEIDEAMDAFIEPLIHFDQNVPDPCVLKSRLQRLSQQAEGCRLAVHLFIPLTAKKTPWAIPLVPISHAKRDHGRWVRCLTTRVR
jgi:hypothetical protein